MIQLLETNKPGLEVGQQLSGGGHSTASGCRESSRGRLQRLQLTDVLPALHPAALHTVDLLLKSGAHRAPKAAFCLLLHSRTLSNTRMVTPICRNLWQIFPSPACAPVHAVAPHTLQQGQPKLHAVSARQMTSRRFPHLTLVKSS